jgi:hypothetical protein
VQHSPSRLDPLQSEDAIEHVHRSWSADPKRVVWSQDRYPELPPELVLRSIARAMWESAIPTIEHYRARPRQLKRMRRRWVDTLSLQPFVRWRNDAECYHDARPFTWESERDMVDRMSRTGS